MSILKLTSKLALPALLALSVNAFSQELTGYKIFEFKGVNAENEVTTYGDYVFGYSYPNETNFTNPENPDAPGDALWFNQGVAKLSGVEIGAAGSEDNGWRSEGAALGIKNNTVAGPNLSDCDAISYYYKGSAHSFQVEFNPQLCGAEPGVYGDGSNKWGVNGGAYSSGWTKYEIPKEELTLFNTWNESMCGAVAGHIPEVDFSEATQIAWEINNKIIENETQSLMIADVICIVNGGEPVSHTVPPSSITATEFPPQEIQAADAAEFAKEIEENFDGYSVEQTELFENITEEKAGNSEWGIKVKAIIGNEINDMIIATELDIESAEIGTIECDYPLAETLEDGNNGKAGECTAEITVTDGEGEEETATITVTINPADFDYWECEADQIVIKDGDEYECYTGDYETPDITIELLPDGKVGVAYAAIQLTATSDPMFGDVTWSVTGLPAGLTYNATTNEISGTPTAATMASVTVTIKATSMAGTSTKIDEITIAKGDGATLTTPTSNAKTATSITASTIATPSTGQTVEYAIGTSATPPATGWQTGAAFSGLTPETAYYIFARAKANDNYEEGPTAISVAITTNAQSTEKGPGATLAESPALNTKTANSITIDAITAPSNGQVVEYAIGTSTTPPTTGWQTDLTFTDLTAETTYYVFARARENASYLAGTPKISEAITTGKSTPILSPEFAYINSQIPEYYNLKGTPLGIQKPSVPGVYIVKTGSVFKKIAVK